MAETKNQMISKADIGNQVITRIDALCKVGFTMPADYNYVNAIKGAMLLLNDVKNKDRVPALSCCTPNSISTALFKMATLGLDVTKKQAYLIVRGDQLCLEESYFGTCLQARRVSKNYEPIANVIYKGDTFKFEVNPETGRKRIVEHTQTLESIDSGEMVGAYAIVTNDKGETDVEIMSMAQIKKSWAKSSSSQQLVHKEFPDQMAKRTVIKRAAKMLINSALSENTIPDDELEPNNELDPTKQIAPDYAEYEEVEEATPAEAAPVQKEEAKKEEAVKQPASEPEPF